MRLVLPPATMSIQRSNDFGIVLRVGGVVAIRSNLTGRAGKDRHSPDRAPKHRAGDGAVHRQELAWPQAGQELHGVGRIVARSGASRSS